MKSRFENDQSAQFIADSVGESTELEATLAKKLC